MQAISKRLTYANVVSTLALFLVLAGGAAYAAKVAKKSVGPAQLKANAVTTAKIKANSVTTRKIKRNAVANGKIKNGAVESEKIADGSVSSTTSTEPRCPSRGSSQGARQLEAGGHRIVQALSAHRSHYIQAPTENDTFIGALDVTFSADAKRRATVTAHPAARRRESHHPRRSRRRHRPRDSSKTWPGSARSVSGSSSVFAFIRPALATQRAALTSNRAPAGATN